MNGIKYPTAFFITRADLMTCKHTELQKDVDKKEKHAHWAVKRDAAARAGKLKGSRSRHELYRA